MANSSVLMLGSSLVFGIVLILFLLKASLILKVVFLSDKIAIILLLLVFLAGGYIRFFVVPHNFKTFYEEYEAYNLSRMISDHGEFNMCAAGTLENCKETQSSVIPFGFPFLSAAYMKITRDKSTETIFSLNSILGSLIIILTYLITYIFFNDARKALFSSFLIASHPLAMILSGSGGMETAGLFFIALLLFFTTLYFNNSDALSGIGVFLSSLACFLITPEYVFFSVLSGFTLICYKKAGGMRFAFGGLTLLIPLMIYILPNCYHSILSTDIINFSEVFKSNLLVFSDSKFYVFLFVAVAAVGLITSFSKRFLFGIFMLVHIMVMSLYGKAYDNGDFIRYSLPEIIFLSIYGGAGVIWISNRVTFPFLKNFILSLFTVYILSTSIQLCTVELNDYLTEQDVFFRNNIPNISDNCAVFSMNPSITMPYSKSNSYELKHLSDVDNKSKCMVFLREVFCAVPMKEECDSIISVYNQEDIVKTNIYGYYDASITRLLQKETLSNIDAVDTK